MRFRVGNVTNSTFFVMNCNRHLDYGFLKKFSNKKMTISNKRVEIGLKKS